MQLLRSVSVEQARAPRTSGGAASPAQDVRSEKLAHDFSNVRVFDEERAFLQSAFGRDLRGIRLHAGPDANAAARSYDADAFTVGRDIFVDRSVANAPPRTRLRILAHEVAHSLQQRDASGVNANVPVSSRSDAHEREAERIADAALSGRAVPSPTHAPPHIARALKSQFTSMDRSDFETELKTRFSVQDIHTGGFIEQQQMVNTRRGITPNPGLTGQMWNSWDPGSSSAVYKYIIEAFENVAYSFGGLPDVQHVVFFDMHYEMDDSGVAHAQPETGADYGAGTLNIFHAASRGLKALPIARSVPSGKYANAPLLGVSTQGSTPGAPLAVPTPRQSVERVISHELGHGVAEAALFRSSNFAGLDPSMMTDYAKTVGWYTSGGAPELYDAGRGDVRDALRDNKKPPHDALITSDHWNDPQWIEQPISLYMVDANDPSEDFAEAVMAYVSDPPLLKARSPRRYNFIDSRKSKWLPNLKPPKTPNAQTQPTLPTTPQQSTSPLLPF